MKMAQHLLACFAAPFFVHLIWCDAAVCVLFVWLFFAEGIYYGLLLLGSGDRRRAQAWLLLWRENHAWIICCWWYSAHACCTGVQAKGITDGVFRACWLARCVSFHFYTCCFRVSHVE